MKNFKTLFLLLAFAFTFTASATAIEKQSDEITVVCETITTTPQTIINQNLLEPMANISINVNLTQLKHLVKDLKGASGTVKCLIIPIKENDLFEGEKNISLSLNAFQLKEPRADSKTTHLVKQQLSKELFNMLSDDEKRAMPIIGDAVCWGSREADPVESSTISSADLSDDEHDDLPF